MVTIFKPVNNNNNNSYEPNGLPGIQIIRVRVAKRKTAIWISQTLQILKILHYRQICKKKSSNR